MGRVPRRGEPRWTEEDTALALEWQRLQQETCGGCWHSLADSMDEGNDYEAVKVMCFACQAKERKEKDLAEAENADTSGMKITAVFAGRRPLRD